jgi:hypothetical protein
MAKNGKVITRRDFIRAGSYLAVGGLAGLPLLGSSDAKTPEKSRVVLIRDREVLDSAGEPRPGALAGMMDQGVAALMNRADAVSAWKKLIKPDDVVGVKSNVWGYLPTPDSLEAIIQMRLMDAGVRKENMAVDDRGVLEHPVFRRSTALINVRPMRTHHWSGLGTLIKNYIMFTPQPWSYHGNACERLGAVWRLPHVKGKTRLNILVMLTPLFHGIGPHHFSSRYVWQYKGLVLSLEPVAADAVGARIIQAKRNSFFKADSPISPPPLHIRTAGIRYHLGNSSPERIDLIRLGWDEDILI